MMEHAALRPALRALAIGIALLGALDPPVTSLRSGRPTIALTTASSSKDSPLVDRVAQVLDKDFVVARAPLAAAAATVMVGDGLPGDPTELAAPVFGVRESDGSASVSIVGVRAPSVVPLSARASIAMTATVANARGRTLDVVLRANGLVVDRTTRSIAGDDERFVVPLAFVPTAAGASSLRVTASISGTLATATSDLVVEARDARWSVLFFDPRPSWMSTFVRRAVERDPRFVVTSRVVTSRNVSIDAGRPPAQVGDLATMSDFDAVVVGAPDALSEADITGLDTYLRRRGGSVVLLLDQREPAPYTRLANTGPLVASTDSALLAVSLDGRDSTALRGTEFVWAERVPVGAEVIARTVPNTKRTGAMHPVMWRSSVGAGRLVVNGALDAWRYRDRSRFDEVWQTLIAELANAAPPAVDVRLSDASPVPGERIRIDVTLRDAALQEANAGRAIRASVRATLTRTDSASEPTEISLLPLGATGRLGGVVRAPNKPGVYRVTVVADGNEASAPLVVATDAAHRTPDDRDLVASFVGARGGRVMSSAQVADLPGELRRVIHPAPHLETWHPMRSAWWIVPFAIFLSAEWWLRRRRGLA